MCCARLAGARGGGRRADRHDDGEGRSGALRDGTVRSLFAEAGSFGRTLFPLQLRPTTKLSQRGLPFHTSGPWWMGHAARTSRKGKHRDIPSEAHQTTDPAA